MTIVMDQAIRTVRRPAAARLVRHLNIAFDLVSQAWAALGHNERLRQMSDLRLDDIGLSRQDIPDSRGAADRSATQPAFRFHLEL